MTDDVPVDMLLVSRFSSIFWILLPVTETRHTSEVLATTVIAHGGAFYMKVEYSSPFFVSSNFLPADVQLLRFFLRDERELLRWPFFCVDLAVLLTSCILRRSWGSSRQ